MLCKNKNRFLLPFLIFIYFFTYIALVSISNVMWDRSGKSRYPFFLPDQYYIISIILAVGFFVDDLYYIEEVPFHSYLIEHF